MDHKIEMEDLVICQEIVVVVVVVNNLNLENVDKQYLFQNADSEIWDLETEDLMDAVDLMVDLETIHAGGSL